MSDRPPVKFDSKTGRLIYVAWQTLMVYASIALVMVIVYGLAQFFTCGPCDWELIKWAVWSKE